jgi:IS605 OrfB family transposase
VPCGVGQGFVGTVWQAASVRTAYRCRAYPDAAQQAMLNRTFGCLRVVWNHILAARRERYATQRTGTSYGQASAELTAMKKDPQRAWLNEVSCVPLQQALRHLARCQKGSANRAKARVKVARAQRKARNARQDFLHRTTTRLVRGNDLIAIEDLNVSGMVRNRRLARAISDCGWGEFRRQLQYKCERAGRRLIVIDRWYPSTKTCSACGFWLAELPLKVRAWRCPSCRVLHDRDLNAAKNILAAGHAAARSNPGDACGADVRHLETPPVQSAVKQEPHLARAGIPILQGGE